MFGFSPIELAVCFLIVLLLFGVKKLPELGSGLGQGISNFRKSYKDGQAIDVTPRDENANKTPPSSDSKEPSKDA